MGRRQIWGPEFDTPRTENIQQVIDLDPLLDEVLAEIKNHTSKLCNIPD